MSLQKLDELPAFVANLKATLTTTSEALLAQLDRATNEITTKLQQVITNPDLPAGVAEDLESVLRLAQLPNLRSTAQALDDIVPDEQPPVEPPVVEPPVVEPPVDPIDPANPPE